MGRMSFTPELKALAQQAREGTDSRSRGSAVRRSSELGPT
jgi:hypothetical protein